MTEIIRVKILEDGVFCREVNRFMKPIDPAENKYISTISNFEYGYALANWEEAESKLRTFRIENIIGCEKLEVGSIHQAEVINNETVRII